MTDETTRQQACTMLRAEIAAILVHYPDLTDTELQRVLRWFRKEANAMDVAMLSCEQDIAPQYRRAPRYVVRYQGKQDRIGKDRKNGACKDEIACLVRQDAKIAAKTCKNERKFTDLRKADHHCRRGAAFTAEGSG